MSVAKETLLLIRKSLRCLGNTAVAEIISADDRLRRPVFPEQRIADLRPANPKRRIARLRCPKEDRLRPTFLEQRSAGLRPANPERRIAAIYCGCINDAVPAYLAAGGAPRPHYKFVWTSHAVLSCNLVVDRCQVI